MERLPNRQSSFAKAKRVKPQAGKTSSAISLKWPHSNAFRATPDTLAEAGFYFDPSYEERDNVTCFLCSKQLSDWDENDDPFDIHWSKCKTSCAWAIVRCGLKYDFDDEGHYVFQKSRVPTAKGMEKARLQTFILVGTWPHQDKNHGAHQKRMAQAGFVYTPQHENDDLATCLYCSTSLSGWEDDDDPLWVFKIKDHTMYSTLQIHCREEHRKRVAKHNLDCPFFAVPASSSKPNAKAVKPVSSKKRSQSTATTRSRAQSVAPTESDVDMELAAADSSTSVATTANGRPPRTTRSKSRAPVNEEVGTTKGKAPKKTPNKITSKTVKPSPSDVDEDSDASSGKTPAPPKRGRPKKSVTTETGDEESKNTDALEAVTATPKPKASRSAKTPGTVTRASSRTNTKQKVKTSVESDREAEEPEQTHRGAVRRAATTVEEISVSESCRAPPKRKGKSKTAATATNPATDDESEGNEAEEDREGSLTRPEPVDEDHPAIEPDRAFSINLALDEPASSQMSPPSSRTTPFTDREHTEEQPLSIWRPPPVDMEDAVVEISSDEEAVQDHDAQSPNAPASRPCSSPLPAKPGRSFGCSIADPAIARDPEIIPLDVEMAMAEAPITPQQQARNLSQKQNSLVERNTTLNNQPQCVVNEDFLPFQPPLAVLPIERIQGMTEVELSMTVEEWIRHEMQVQYDTFKADGERKIHAFQERAKSTRKAIESM
jgi:hypothetical protein